MRKIFLISMLSLFVFCSTGYAEMVDNGDGTVTDTKTGLMWQKADTGAKTWKKALEYCDTLVLANHGDWRLPNLDELKSIVNSISADPSVYKTAFPNASSYNYWSFTTKEDATDYALTMFIKEGEMYAELGDIYPSVKNNGYNVKAFRGGQ